MDENQIVIRDPKSFCFNFDWPKDVDEHLKHKNEYVIKKNESLAENKMKNKKLHNYCLNISMETIFMNTENSRTKEPHKFVLSLSQRLGFRNSNNYVAPQNLSIRGKI